MGIVWNVILLFATPFPSIPPPPPPFPTNGRQGERDWVWIHSVLMPPRLSHLAARWGLGWRDGWLFRLGWEGIRKRFWVFEKKNFIINQIFPHLWIQWLIFKRHFLLSVCHTTRSPRTKEENLEDYFFVTQEEFEQGVVMVRFHSALDCLALFIFPLMC